ncbi:hypothetical protein, partial [Falsiroseomonas oryzae]|uniref:hypothetical protein n=1 Tax=Falsiroseomonas oryzae TaxID=2766473 RepID=UPI0022EAEED5
MDDDQDRAAAGPTRSLEDAYARAALFAQEAHRALHRASRGAARLFAWARDGAGYLGLPDPSPADGEEEWSGRRQPGRPPGERVWHLLFS